MAKLVLLFLLSFVFNPISLSSSSPFTPTFHFSSSSSSRKILHLPSPLDHPSKDVSNDRSLNPTTKLPKSPTSASLKNPKKLDANPVSGPLNSHANNSPSVTASPKKSSSHNLNSTSKASNSTKSASLKISSDSARLSSSKNKTAKATTSNDTDRKIQSQNKTKPPPTPPPPMERKLKSQKSSVIDRDEEEDDDLVSELRDLPSRLQETLLPDLERISTTSKAYLNRANKHITKGFKPIVGNKYAPTIASLISFAFILIPFVLVSLIFNRVKAYFSLQKLIVFVQIYLSIYFTILCLSALATGLEPLKLFYATAQSTYVCVQVMQTLGYVLYLLMLLMYMVLVFGTDTGIGSKMLALGQTLVGLAVGLHYYVTVFHRTVLKMPPKTSWKVHAIYAAMFMLICWLATADRRKKAYLQDGGEEDKKS